MELTRYPQGLASALRKLANDPAELQHANRGTAHLYIVNPIKKFQGRADSEKLIAALEGLEMKESADFPTGDKLLRKEDHQAFVRETIFEMREGKYHVLDTIPWQKSEVPPACTFA